MARRESLRRRGPTRKVLPRILIVCEGTKTEPGYFEDLRQLYRRVVELALSPGGVPKTLVNRAAEMKRVAERAAKAAKDENLLYDEVWCVFDIDDHPGVGDARQQARDNGINLAISNPCFELWVLLHFQDQRAHISRTDLRAACRKYLPGYKKDLPMDELSPHHDQATTRARNLDAWQNGQGREHANPSTGVYRLTQSICGFDEAQR
jgi:RloB-like protein